MAVRYGISIGLLAGIWTWASMALAIPTWPGFVAWALFFASGADVNSIWKVIVQGVTGVILGYLGILAAPFFGAAFGVPIVVVFVAFLLCVVSVIKPWVFIPAGFGGCACFFGAGTISGSAIPLICGALLGYLSAVLAVAGMKKETNSAEQAKA